MNNEDFFETPTHTDLAYVTKALSEAVRNLEGSWGFGCKPDLSQERQSAMNAVLNTITLLHTTKLIVKEKAK